MFERQSLLKSEMQKKKEKIEKNLRENEEREAYERMKKRQDQLNKPLIKHEIEWKEFELLESERRKARIEQRRQELAITLANAGPSYDSKSKRPVVETEYYRVFKATEDHDKVVLNAEQYHITTMIVT